MHQTHQRGRSIATGVEETRTTVVVETRSPLAVDLQLLRVIGSTPNALEILTVGPHSLADCAQDQALDRELSRRCSRST